MLLATVTDRRIDITGSFADVQLHVTEGSFYGRPNEWKRKQNQIVKVIIELTFNRVLILIYYQETGQGIRGLSTPLLVD